MVRAKVITLLTDYGLDDPYVAEVKAVILSIARNVQIVDITHNVPSFDEKRGAFLLLISAKYFPRGTVHVCVVDPKVGTERRGIIVLTKREHTFVGPDTGLMWPAAKDAGIKKVYKIDYSKLPPRGCETFHGRDVFAYVAAKLANGIKPSRLGVEVEGMTKLDLFELALEDGTLCGEVMHIDKFGNIITNVSENSLKLLGGLHKIYEVTVNNKFYIVPFCRTYGDVPQGTMLILFGGTGFLEISVNMGSAAEVMGARIGEKAYIRPVSV